MIYAMGLPGPCYETMVDRGRICDVLEVNQMQETKPGWEDLSTIVITARQL